MIKIIRDNQRIIFFIILILLSTTSMAMSKQYEDQTILSESKIKKRSYNKVFRNIRKTLPKQSKECPIIVTQVKLLKREGESVAEDWTVNICQETKVYLINTFHPKGYYCDVISKEEALAQEKEYWDAAKRHGDEEFWRKFLFYVEELEAIGEGDSPR